MGEGVGSFGSTLSVMRHVEVGDEAVVHGVEIFRITPAKPEKRRSYRDGGYAPPVNRQFTRQITTHVTTHVTRQPPSR